MPKWSFTGVSISGPHCFLLKAVAESTSNVSFQSNVCVMFLMSVLYCGVVREVVIQIFDLVHDCIQFSHAICACVSDCLGE